MKTYNLGSGNIPCEMKLLTQSFQLYNISVNKTENYILCIYKQVYLNFQVAKIFAHVHISMQKKTVSSLICINWLIFENINKTKVLKRRVKT